MQEKRIKLEEILNKFCIVEGYFCPIRDYKDAMKEACRQTLELAAENARIMNHIPNEEDDREYKEVSKQSILNTINQIE